MIWETLKPSITFGSLQRTPACSRDPGMLWEQGSKLGARGASWGLPEAPGRFQGPRDALGAKGASWEQAGGFLRSQEGSRDPGMFWEQGK